MEGLVKGLEGVAIDEVEGTETWRDRGACPVDGDREERSRSTWAEVLVTYSIQCRIGVL